MTVDDETTQELVDLLTLFILTLLYWDCLVIITFVLVNHTGCSRILYFGFVLVDDAV